MSPKNELSDINKTYFDIGNGQKFKLLVYLVISTRVNTQRVSIFVDTFKRYTCITSLVEQDFANRHNVVFVERIKCGEKNTQI